MTTNPQADLLVDAQLDEAVDVGGGAGVLAPPKTIAPKRTSNKEGSGEDVLSAMRLLIAKAGIDPAQLAVPKDGSDTGSGEGDHHEQKALDVFDPDQNNAEEEEQTIDFGESMYTLMFTAPKLISPAFIVAMLVYVIAVATLGIALVDQLSNGQEGNSFGVPPDVSDPVRTVQFLAILIGWLMEEEIPTALEMLAKISRNELTDTPFNYNRVVFSACCRLLLGYLFLASMLVTVIQAETVLGLFLDLLGLQFIESLDDVIYGVVKKGMFGRGLDNEATKYSDLGIKIRSDSAPIKCNLASWAKGIYFMNLVVLYAGFFVVMANQETGNYQCKQVTIEFSDEIWDGVRVKGDEEERVLMYPFFSGTYVLEEKHDERPVYVEQNKKNGGTFDEAITKPAKFRYCESEKAWVFYHEDIIRTREGEENEDDSECPWLLKSPETEAFDLTLVPESDWSVWVGTIVNGASLTITCDECESDADCNFNGNCKEQKCMCSENEFYGNHCELKFPCEHIQDDYGTDYSIINITVDSKDSNNLTDYNITDIETNEGQPNFITSYNRPIYQGDVEDGQKYTNALVFAGSRWFHTNITTTSEDGISQVVKELYDDDFHGFWDRVYDPIIPGEEDDAYLIEVSEPTYDKDPIGVDFSKVLHGGGDVEPFGSLKPHHDSPDQGFYHCKAEQCQGMEKVYEKDPFKALCEDHNFVSTSNDVSYLGISCANSHTTYNKCVCNGGQELPFVSGFFCHIIDTDAQDAGGIQIPASVPTVSPLNSFIASGPESGVDSPTTDWTESPTMISPSDGNLFVEGDGESTMNESESPALNPTLTDITEGIQLPASVPTVSPLNSSIESGLESGVDSPTKDWTGSPTMISPSDGSSLVEGDGKNVGTP